LVATLLAAPASTICLAQADQPTTEMIEFWTRFKAAVLKNDKEAVADMTELPISVDDEAVTREYLIGAFATVFDDGAKQGFREANLLATPAVSARVC
jgi:hypothetical protein